MARIENKISEIMGRKRMKISELSRQTGLSYPAAYSLWKGTTKSISFDTMARLCEVLDVHPGELFVYVSDELKK